MLAEQPQAQDAPAPRPVNESDDPVLKRFVWRSIGPAVMGGRVDDIAVDESNPSTFYVGYATGGIWKTVNNGTTWTPIFDEFPVSSIGDIELAPSNPNIIYVGTGEPNNRQSSSFGAGVYKSTDGGLKFEYVGLKETQSIAKVVVHPKDPNTVYVAAVGHLFGPNPERGVFKIDRRRQDLDEHEVHRQRHGLHRSRDAPDRPEHAVRRVLSAPPAAVGLQRRRPRQRHLADERRRQDLDAPHGQWPPDDAGHRSHRPQHQPVQAEHDLRAARSRAERRHRCGRQRRRHARASPEAEVVAAAAAAAAAGGEAPPPDPTESGVWRSDDGGKSWKFMSNNNNRPMYYSKIRVDPSNPEIVYTTGASAYKSVDGGKTFNVMGGQSHSDHHALWINPRNGQHLDHRQRRRRRHQLRPGDDVGRAQPGGARPVLRHQRRHAEAVLRVRRPAGQRIVVRPERRAERGRHHERRLVPHRRR